MKYSKYQDPKTIAILSDSYVSYELRHHLARLVEQAIGLFDAEHYVRNIARVVQRAMSVSGQEPVTLEINPFDGEPEINSGTWFIEQQQSMFLDLDVPQLAELLCEMLEAKWLSHDSVNALLREDGAVFSIEQNSSGPRVKLESVDIQSTDSEQHPNVAQLLQRMDHALANRDYPLVLHSAASAFETLAKELLNTPSVEDQTLGGIFDGYRKRSRLPEPVLDYVLELYKRRNTEPTAAHGHTSVSTLTREEAVTICEITRAFVRIEYTIKSYKPDCQ